MTTGAPLVLFNSLSRAAEPFVPIDPAMVRVYSCGPTVYARQHLGNMRAYLFTDTLTRVLRWKGYDVTHVINITDVGHLTSDADAGDDKIEKAAASRAADRRSGMSPARYTEALQIRPQGKLNILEPTRWSVATDHIADMIAFARVLADGGHRPMRSPSGLYFDVTTVPDYGRLGGRHRGPDDMIGRIAERRGQAPRRPISRYGGRSEAPGERRQMEWESPWGTWGRPAGISNAR